MSSHKDANKIPRGDPCWILASYLQLPVSYRKEGSTPSAHTTVVVVVVVVWERHLLTRNDLKGFVESCCRG